MKFAGVGRVFALFLTAIFCMVASNAVQAQQDGARGYMLGPEGVRGWLLMTNFSSANQTTDNGIVVVGSHVSSIVSVAEYAQPFSVAGNSASIFVLQPVGTVSGRVNIGGQTFSNTSSGIGDFAVGGMLGLIGMPALPLQSYLTYKPGFSLAAVGVVMAPTGTYDRTQVFNLGTNRWAFRAAFPMSYTIGQSFLDPSLMTFELKPSITAYTTNDAPFGARWQTQDPFYELEGHVTRNLSSTFWLSGDAIYQYGARTFTNGINDNNARMNLNLGATVGISLSPSIQFRASYARAVVRNEYGFDGQGVRLMLLGSF